MKPNFDLRLVAVLVAVGCFPLLAQEDVTISKSRLKELEQKEAELQKLKGETESPARATESKTPTTVAPSVSAQSTAPTVKSESASLASLPPLVDGQTVDAVDLAGYYRQDRSSADQRFRKRKIVVRGEIIGFGKPLFSRNFRIVLRGGQETKVRCDLVSPDNFKSVFTVDDGAALVGLEGETRIPIAKIGGTVEISGVCKGLRDSSVFVQGKDLRVAP